MSDFVQIPDLAFDYAVVAEYIADSRRRSGKTIPDVAQLSTAITSVELQDTMEGSSTLTVDIIDPDWQLLPYFEVAETGRVEMIEVNYPPGSHNWWRMTALEVNQQVDSTMVTLIFMERPAVLLMHHLGPVHASRGKYTRAEFLKTLVDQVKANGGLRFSSKQLHDKQRIAGNTPVVTDPAERKRVKFHGINKNAKLKIQGVRATPDQLTEVERALDAAYELDAPHLAVRALMVAGIGESGFDNHVINSKGYGGTFQGDVRAKTHEWANDYTDTNKMAKSFLKGGRGFQNGGAIKLAAPTTTAQKTPGQIALLVEASAEQPSYYDKYADEGDALIKEYKGGFSDGPSYYRQQYNFRIGDDNNPRVDYWTGMQDLAEEVNWRLFIDGNTVYFDSDYTLIKQKSAAIIDRNDSTVLGWTARWDGRKRATEMTLDMICDPFAYRAGDVFKLEGFGPLSDGSTARPVPFPGHWLIFEAHRLSGDIFTRFTLTQPERPNREPAADVGERPQDDEEIVGDIVTGIGQEMTPREIIEQYVLPMGRKHDCKTPYGAPLTPANVETANRNHDKMTSSGNISDHWLGNGDSAYAVDMSNGDHPTKQMDALAKELLARFDMGKENLPSPNATQGSHPENNVTISHGTRRYQLIYRTDNPVGHFNHVHFGIHILAGPPSPSP